MKIRRLELGDEAGVRALIQAGLRERFDPHLEGYDPDLNDLWAHHLEFLADEIVATGGLKLEDARTVRYSKRLERAVLTTGADWHSAIALYERAGFSSTHSSFESATSFHSLEFVRDLTADRR